MFTWVTPELEMLLSLLLFSYHRGQGVNTHLSINKFVTLAVLPSYSRFFCIYLVCKNCHFICFLLQIKLNWMEFTPTCQSSLALCILAIFRRLPLESSVCRNTLAALMCFTRTSSLKIFTVLVTKKVEIISSLCSIHETFHRNSYRSKQIEK